MSKEYNLEVYSQPSIYGPRDRTMRIYFDEPDQGVSADTGILLLVAGYGGHSNSKIFKKMRSLFADRYNMVTIQCDYMGWEFMQVSDEINQLILTPDNLREHLTDDQISRILADPMGNLCLLDGLTITNIVSLPESFDSLNDMGPAQAMDQIIALKIVMDILEDNNLLFDWKKIFAYGFSHGAYLSLLANCFCPHVFSGIICNSAYLFPYYMDHDRVATRSQGSFAVSFVYRYMLKYLTPDRTLYDLTRMYGKINNQANIVEVHGTDDHMTATEDICSFMDGVPRSHLEIIDSSRVDHKIFYSTKHGTDADFIHFFEYVYEKFSLKTETESGTFEDRTFETPQAVYKIQKQEGVPFLTMCRKCSDGGD